MTSVIRGSDDFDSGLGLGVGQTWQDVTGSRASGVTYTNTSGRPIMVAISQGSAGTQSSGTVTVGGVLILTGSSVAGQRTLFSFVVPASSTYEVSLSGGIAVRWAELR